MIFQTIGNVRNLLRRNFQCFATHSQQTEVGEVKNVPPENISGLNNIKLRTIDKRILVWTGKYKRIQDVPNQVSRSLLASSHARARVKVCNYMIVLVIAGCFYFAWKGKQEAKEGHSVKEIAMQYHLKYNKEYEEKHKEQKLKD